jgi:hypothetical protein
MDWEGAAKADYVREHGAEPAWLDVDDLTPEERRAKHQRLTKAETQTIQTLGERVARLKRDFQRLEIPVRYRQLDEFRQRIDTVVNHARLQAPAASDRFRREIAALREDALVSLAQLTPTEQIGTEKQRHPPTKVFSNQSPSSVSVQARLVEGGLQVSWTRCDDVVRWRVVIKKAMKVIRASEQPARMLRAQFAGDFKGQTLAVRIFGTDGKGSVVAKGNAKISSN